MTAPQIRPATADDLVTIGKLLAAESLPPFDYADYLDTFWLAEDSEGPSGCIGLEIYEDTALLRSIVSAPRARGTGLGAALTRHVLSEAKSHGAKSVYLFTMDKAPFFEHMGFSKISLDDFEPSIRQSTQYRTVIEAPAQVREVLTTMRREI